MIFSTLEHILTHISFSIVSIVITLHLITLLGNEIIKPYDSSEKGMIATFLCLTGLLTTRWIYSGHFPLSDLYESLIFLSWSFSLIHIVPYFKIRKNDLTTITASITIFTQGFATSGLLNEIHKPTILVPALQSEWLIMHVSMMILSYAALLCGSLLSVALLVITFRNIFYSSKSILSGAVWANEAWGSYWSWDPKETWAFITWIVFAIYLHTRTNKNLQGANSAIVATLGFLIIWICYFGVNLLGIGLHSYGSFTLTYS
ncbi:putative cytochrome c assembly protein [Helianthus debilis subsp. tardiflorus]|uniref:Putative cytochrome c biogenesis protein CcsA n=1 Tax=Helianthus annuus TaxID=4232 RepID=A0A1Y3BTJ6_HELAN